MVTPRSLPFRTLPILLATCSLLTTGLQAKPLTTVAAPSQQAGTPKPIRRKPVVAWEAQLDDPIVAAPVVGERHVVVAVDKGRGKGALVVLDMRTGKELDEISLVSPEPLKPVGKGDWLAVPIGKDKLAVYRWTGKKLQHIRSSKMPGAVDVVALEDGELYAGGEFGLVRQSLRSSQEEWKTLGRFVGEIEVHDQTVYAVRGGANQQSSLVGLDRRTGTVGEELAIGTLPGDISALRVRVTGNQVWVGGAGPMKIEGYEGLGAGPGLLLERPLVQGASLSPLVNRHACAPSAWREGWVGYLQGEKGTAFFTAIHGEQPKGIVDDKDGPSLFGDPLYSPIVLGDVMYLGSAAIELPSQRVLWRLDAAPRFRPALAGSSLIVVDGEHRVFRLGAPRSTGEPYLAASYQGEPFTGVALGMDGSLTMGDMRLDSDAGEWVTISRKGKEKGAPLSNLRLVENDQGEALYVADPLGFEDSLHERIRAGLARDYSDLAYDARSTNDVKLMQALLDLAEQHGSSDARMKKVADAIQKLTKKPKNVVLRKVKAIKERRAALSTRDARTWRLTQALPAEAPLVMRVAGLRATLDAEPLHAEATAAVRGLLPDGLDVGADFRAGRWLDFVVAAERAPVKIVPQPKSESEADADQVKLGRALHMGWRKDLFGVRSENLLIITPVARPEALTRCLLTGELVCEVLEEIFESADPMRNTRDPLILFLYPTKEEYLTQSADKGGEAGSGLSWTAGHYDPADNLSRIFLPEDDEDFEGVQRTYTHEIAHHWIMARCPRLRTEELGSMRPDKRGYWIVEGFASMIEEFAFDTTAWTWDPIVERAERLDTVASAEPGQLLPWKRVLDSSQIKFTKFGKLPSATVPLGWRLGWASQVSETNLFYAQSAAACAYLFLAEDGARREALLTYLVDYYAGRVDALDLEAAFGMDADAIGAGAVEFARVVGRGGGR